MPISDYHVVGDASLAQSPSGQTTIVIQTPDKANQLSYNNTSSGLSATNVQSAIDEVFEDVSEDTTVTTSTDSTPYLYRKSKAIGDREYLEYIDGGSLGWNQLVQNTDTSCTVQSGHKYVLKQGSTYTLAISDGNAFTVDGSANDNVYDLTLALGSTIADYVYSLEQATAGSGIAWLKEQGLFTDEYYAYDAGSIKSVNVSGHKMIGFNQWDEEWELGALNGNTGMNYPSSNSIRSKNYIPVFPNTNMYIKIPTGYINFYGYDANKNFLGSINAYSQKANTTFTITSKTYFVRMEINSDYGISYNHDICFNISNSAKNGTYEPYEEHTYPITSTDLLGIPILTSDNKLGFDGDRYNANGRVDRKYSIVDLGTLDYTYDSTNAFFKVNFTARKGNTDCVCSLYAWGGYKSDADMASASNLTVFDNMASWLKFKNTSYTDAATFKTAMSGQYLVYEKATPTTENVTPIINPQICSPYGTEEFISDSPVPVPHSTEYYKTPDWMDVEPFKSERENNDSNTLKVAELASTRPELKSKALSGTTYANGNINSGLSNVIIVGVVFPRINNNYYVGVPFYGANNGAVWIHVMLDDCNTPANQLDVTGTLYYYEL